MFRSNCAALRTGCARPPCLQLFSYMASGRSGGYILSKRPPPSPDKPTTGGFKQRRTAGLTAEGATIITGAQQDVGPLEDWDHAGSGGRYMAYKNKKLHEQFAENAARERASWEPQAAQDATLFRGVSIFVNGLTDPPHLELKQIMALHGGRFVNYYSRDTVTHIICSNLTDAKVKIFERERNPKPVVRPEWIVDSMKAHRLLPHEGYVLQRLRAQPGQKLLAGFQTGGGGSVAKDSVYPQARARSIDPPNAADLASQLPAAQGGAGPSKPQQQLPTAAEQQTAQPQVAAAPGSTDADSPRPSAASRLPAPDAAATADSRQQTDEGSMPAVQAVVSANDASRPGGAARPEAARALGSGGSQHPSPPAAMLAQPGDELELSLQLPPDPDEGARAAFAGDPPSPSPGQQPKAPVRNASLPQQQQQPHQAPQQQPPYPPVADDMALAQQVAAQKRAACDVLKGPPRTSRDDPEFMNTFFKASRLHWIGTWKARIDALLAVPPEATPQPATAQPSVAAALQGQRRGAERMVIHLDMDCFFASIATQGHPSFRGKPLAVCHSNSAVGTAEVSSANYEARAFGVHAGMSMSRAKQRCPHLLVLPYEFDKYEDASESVYKILLKHTAAVQPVSCDEAYLDISGLGDPLAMAAAIRAQIEEMTGCTASAGIGPNMLLARLATKRAKPNGVFRYSAAEAQADTAALPLADLPGVGWSLQQRLAELGLVTAADVRMATKERLQRELGDKTGANLWDMAHGRDSRVVQPPKPRKSLGAEVNWGIRFRNQQDADVFLLDLAGEVASRLAEAGVKGRSLTLKIKRRKEGAPEPSKFMGHGICDNLSRSLTLGRFIDSAADIAAEAGGLMRALRVPPCDIRGIGITVTKLSNDPASNSAKPTNTAPAKGIAPPASVFDPAEPHPWAAHMLEQVKEEEKRKAAVQQMAPPERPWADAGPAGQPAAPQSGSPAKAGRPSSGPVAPGLWSSAPAEPAAAQPDASASPALEAQHGDQPCAAGAKKSSGDIDFTFDVVRPPRGARSAAASAAKAADVLPSFLQRAMAAAAPLDGAAAAEAPAHAAGSGKPAARAADAAAVHVNAQAPHPNAAEPLPTAPTQDSPLKPRPQQEVAPAQPLGIMTLPPVSQLDQSVMDSLPLVTRRELELAYGINNRRKPAPRQQRVTAEPRRQPRSATTRPAAPAPPPASRWRDSPCHILPPAAAQVDEDVLAELPEDVQAEVLPCLL